MGICQKVLAVWEPKRTDDLCDGSEVLLGKELIYQHSGLIDEGPWAGDIIMVPIDIYPFVGWVPLSELRIIRKVGQVKEGTEVIPFSEIPRPD